ncbi:MAG: hypothetical protein U0270_21250 [Labilithrix sp.]
MPASRSARIAAGFGSPKWKLTTSGRSATSMASIASSTTKLR